MLDVTIKLFLLLVRQLKERKINVKARSGEQKQLKAGPAECLSAKEESLSVQVGVSSRSLSR